MALSIFRACPREIAALYRQAISVTRLSRQHRDFSGFAAEPKRGAQKAIIRRAVPIKRIKW